MALLLLLAIQRKPAFMRVTASVKDEEQVGMMNSSGGEWMDCPRRLVIWQYIVMYLGWQKTFAVGSIQVLLKA